MRYSEKTIQRIYLLISSPSFAGLLPRSDLELATIHDYPVANEWICEKRYFHRWKTSERLVLALAERLKQANLPLTEGLDPMSFSPRVIRSSGRQILKVILSRLAFYLDSGSQQ
jgi:hypothetical protein